MFIQMILSAMTLILSKVVVFITLLLVIFNLIGWTHIPYVYLIASGLFGVLVMPILSIFMVLIGMIIEYIKTTRDF